uniref:Uncharacterized protein n=1 Tax=Anguilla anguilla TaxID=7936 RepID=A0A0E9X7G2_ANGAN
MRRCKPSICLYVSNRINRHFIQHFHTFQLLRHQFLANIHHISVHEQRSSKTRIYSNHLQNLFRKNTVVTIIHNKIVSLDQFTNKCYKHSFPVSSV